MPIFFTPFFYFSCHWLGSSEIGRVADLSYVVDSPGGVWGVMAQMAWYGKPFRKEGYRSWFTFS